MRSGRISFLYFCPYHEKAVLCAAYLPEWVHADLSIDSVFISLLQERGIHTVNMMEFIRADGNTPPYYKRGSHWTQPTQLTTAKVVCEVSGILSRAEERITEIVPLGERSEEFGVLGYAGIATNRRIENILKATTSPKYKIQRKTAEAGFSPEYVRRSFGLPFRNKLFCRKFFYIHSAFLAIFHHEYGS